MICAVIFDMDGVLVDTEHLWDEVREALTEEWGGRYTPEAQEAMMGRGAEAEDERDCRDRPAKQNRPRVVEAVPHARNLRRACPWCRCRGRCGASASPSASAALVLPVGGGASQLIARDAKDVTLRVNARGQALVGYRAKSKRWTVLAWGAINARHPVPGRPQVAFRIDSGRLGNVSEDALRGFRNACGRYSGPPLAWFVTGCTMPDGSHWALQAWQRGLPNLGLDPWKPCRPRSSSA